MALEGTENSQQGFRQRVSAIGSQVLERARNSTAMGRVVGGTTLLTGLESLYMVTFSLRQLASRSVAGFAIMSAIEAGIQTIKLARDPKQVINTLKQMIANLKEARIAVTDKMRSAWNKRIRNDEDADLGGVDLESGEGIQPSSSSNSASSIDLIDLTSSSDDEDEEARIDLTSSTDDESQEVEEEPPFILFSDEEDFMRSFDPNFFLPAMDAQLEAAKEADAKAQMNALAIDCVELIESLTKISTPVPEALSHDDNAEASSSVAASDDAEEIAVPTPVATPAVGEEVAPRRSARLLKKARRS